MGAAWARGSFREYFTRQYSARTPSFHPIFLALFVGAARPGTVIFTEQFYIEWARENSGNNLRQIARSLYTGITTESFMALLSRAQSTVTRE